MAARWWPFKSGRYVGPGDPLHMAQIPVDRGGALPCGFFPALPIGNWSAPFEVETCHYNGADYTETKTNSGTIGMAAGGLALVSGAANTNNTTAQMLRARTIAASKRLVCAFRVNFTNVAKGKAALGFYITATDPIGTIPTDGAWIEKSTAGTGVLTFRTATASTATTSATLQTATNGADLDFCILVNGTTNCQVWSKAATSQDWGAPTTHTTNLPTGSMRFSMNITATDANALTMTLPLRMVSMEY